MSENTTLAHELIDALDAEPELADELRRRILTDELLALPQKVDQLAGTVDQLASTVAEGFAAVNTRLDSVEGRIGRVEGQVGNLLGGDYQGQVVREAALLAPYLNVHNAVVIHTADTSTSFSILELVQHSIRGNVISHEEGLNLHRADVVIQGVSTEGTEVFVVGEVSITIDDHDVDRASERARILATITGSEVQSVVIGTTISAANRERARIGNVEVMMLAAD